MKTSPNAPDAPNSSNTRNARTAGSTGGRNVVLFLLAALLLAVGGIIAIGMTGGSKHIPRSRMPVPVEAGADAGDASSAEAGAHAP